MTQIKYLLNLTSFCLILFLTCSSLIGGGNLLRGKVIGITDGDTFTLLDDNKVQYKIRMADIDAPEKSQDYGKVAKQHLSDYIFGKNVNVRWTKKDRNQRIIGEVILNGVNINEAMVRDGYAWQYLDFNKEARLRDIQLEAKNAKRGLWQKPNPIAPWLFRKAKKKKEVSAH